MRTTPQIFAVSLLLVLASPGLRSQTNQGFSGKVVGVTDGDTIRVMREGEAVRVRLEGIDCPERTQDFSQRASQLTSRLVFGEVVSVDVRDVDRYGRLVARVTVNGQDVSMVLVEQGLAWHYTQYSSDSVLAEAERSARSEGIGLWSRPNPIAPWDFRRGDTATVDESTDGHLHGNRRSRVFHRPGCQHYDCPNCTILFDSPEDAVAAGFRPAGDCH